MTLYLLIFKKYIVTKKNLLEYFKNNKVIELLDRVISDLLIDLDSESRYDFWSMIDDLQKDRGDTKNYFGSMGYITGLFSIFKNDEDFCLKIKEINNCFFM